MLPPRWRWRLDRWRQQVGGLLARPRPQPKPRLCPSCGLLVGSEEKSCSHCGASMAVLSLTGLQRVAAWILPAQAPLTYALLFTNLLFFVVAWIVSIRLTGTDSPLFSNLDVRVLVAFGAKSGYHIVVAGEYWRLVMPIFLHFDVIHFGFNSFVLWQVGPQVEELFGSRRFLFIYLVTGVVGFLGSLWWYDLHGRPALSVGSSGAIFGLMGVLISYITQSAGFAAQYRASLIRWAVFILIMGIFLPFDNAAHLGGLLAGLVLGRVVSDRRPATPGQRFTVGLMGWGSAAVILASVALTLLHLRPIGS